MSTQTEQPVAMTIEELSKLSDAGLRVRCAELLAHDEWVIVKRSLYYRPNGAGYTSCLGEAWKLPHSEAKKHEAYVDRKDVPNCEKVFIEKVPPPNYPADLNAMHEVEKTLSERDAWSYRNILQDLVLREQGAGHAIKSTHFLYGATARQRCIAFIATKSNS